MTSTTNGHKGAGDVIRARLLEKHLNDAEIVDVIPEEGFVYKFRKPSKFEILFGSGELPQSAAAEAVAAWNEDGTIDSAKISPDVKIKMAEKAFNLRDKILKYSVAPKLVIGPTTNPDELSTDDVPDAHLEYFFKWMAAGGDASLVLAMFPQGREQHAVAGTNRKVRRAAAKRTRGNK